MKLVLPLSWQNTKLEDLAVFILGGDWGKDESFESKDYSLALCIRGAEFRNWFHDKGCTASPRMIKNSSLSNRKLKLNDILVEISGGGPEQPVGRTVLIDNAVMAYKPELPKVCTNFLRLIRSTNQINAKYINAFLSFFYSSGEIRDYQSGSNNLRNLKFNDYLQIEIPIPPLNEQHRIVAKIEELFSELDQGIDNLKTAQAQLKVYRQALLKHAFEGKLTAEWRAQNADKLESASALQQRIQQARAQGHQQQLAEWETNGKQGTKPKAPKPITPLSAEELAGLPALPEGWLFERFGNVFEIYVGSTPSRKRADFWNGEIPWVSSGEVAFNRIKSTREKISELGYKNASTEIHPIGTVMLGMIGEGKTRGQPAILDIEACHNQNTAAIRVNKQLIPSEYLYQYLAYQYEITRKIGSGNNQKALNKERISEMTIPLANHIEMVKIIEIMETKITEIDQLDQTITTSLQQVEALRQSILKKAFSGELVPQDPNDEPAAALLARIKAEKESVTSKQAKSGKIKT